MRGITAKRFRRESNEEDTDTKAKSEGHPHTVHLSEELLECNVDLLQRQVLGEGVVVLQQHLLQMEVTKLLVRGAVEEVPQVSGGHFIC